MADEAKPKPLSVGLDVTAAITAGTGLARYTEELWRALARRADLEVRAFALGRGSMRDFGLPLRRRHLPLRVLRPLWRRLGYPRAEVFCGRVDVVHTLALMPAPTRMSQVATIHDVLPITHPHLYPPGAAQLSREELTAAARADVIVTTCEATAAEIARVGDLERERILVAPPGPLKVLPASETRTHGVGPYVLAVGVVTPRKGFDVLATAAKLLGESCPPVLIAGPDWWGADQVRETIAASDPVRRVKLLGRVDDGTLAALYRDATVVCHPSRAEGFGMTCLEAMAAGAALVATDLPSVRELVGGSALLVPADDADALAAGLEELLADGERRRALGEAARSLASTYSWDRAAEHVVGAYRTVVRR
jgi:glycosyltransferase involved in cell wall biosynthesis